MIKKKKKAKLREAIDKPQSGADIQRDLNRLKKMG